MSVQDRAQPLEAALAWLARNAIVLVLGAVYALAVLVSDAFLAPGYLGNVVRQAAPVGIAALGVTFVMILGGVDLSVGSVISLTAVVAAVWMDGEVANIAVAVLAALLVGLAVGLANGLLLARFRVSPFILTLGTGIAVAGLAQVYSGGTARGELAEPFRDVFNHRIAGTLPVLALVFLALALIVALILRRTVFGQGLYLAGSNARTALLSGLPVGRLTVAAYAISGLFAALAGLALSARTGVSGSLMGAGMEFQVLAAVVLGGTTFEGGRGGAGGTVAGVLVLVLAFNLVNIAGLPYHLQLSVLGTIIILASALHGRLGRSA